MPPAHSTLNFGFRNSTYPNHCFVILNLGSWIWVGGRTCRQSFTPAVLSSAPKHYSRFFDSLEVKEMNRHIFASTLVLTGLIMVVCGAVFAQDPMPPAESLEKAFKPQKHYSPYAGRNFPTR